MFSAVDTLQGFVLLALSLLVLGMCVFALIDAARAKPGAYVAAGKRTKNFWLIVLGVATAVAFVSQGGLDLFLLLPAVGAGVYLADVRPALKQASGRGGGNGGSGPYGPW